MAAATLTTVGTRKICSTGSVTSCVRDSCAVSRATSSEFPPSSKKSATALTLETPSSEQNVSAISASSCVPGSTKSSMPRSGAGSAAVSILPFGVSGIRSSVTNALGTM